MIKRLFWFAIGAGVAIYAYRKIRSYLARPAPMPSAHRVADSAGSRR